MTYLALASESPILQNLSCHLNPPSAMGQAQLELQPRSQGVLAVEVPQPPPRFPAEKCLQHPSGKDKGIKYQKLELHVSFNNQLQFSINSSTT